jgi:hypothetical protein
MNRTIKIGNLDDVHGCKRCNATVYVARTRSGKEWIVEVDFDDNCDAIFEVDGANLPTVQHTLGRCNDRANFGAPPVVVDRAQRAAEVNAAAALGLTEFDRIVLKVNAREARRAADAARAKARRQHERTYRQLPSGRADGLRAPRPTDFAAYVEPVETPAERDRRERAEYEAMSDAEREFRAERLSDYE